MEYNKIMVNRTNKYHTQLLRCVEKRLVMSLLNTEKGKDTVLFC